MIFKQLIIFSSVIFMINGMFMNEDDRARLLAEAEPDEDLFLAEISTFDGGKSCLQIYQDIQRRCLEVDALVNQTLDEMTEFEDSDSCFVKFRCDINYALSDSLPNEFDDIVEITRESAVIMSGDTNGYWNLDRVDQSSLPLNKNDFESSHTGAGVNVYIVDTGVLVDHEQFEGRAQEGADFAFEGDAIDRHGHGTHCAGTALGKDTGVAKNANLIGVKVLGASGSGSTSGVIKGIEWAVRHQKHNYGGQPAVISLSLGGSKNNAMNSAARNAHKAGHIVVLAAGNNNGDACDVSPAGSGGDGRKGGPITVGSTDKQDRRSSFSNYGDCVDVFAPGSSIKSSWIGWGNNQYKTISGTSMATPLVAGIAATMLEKHGGNRNAAQDELLAIVSLNKLKDVRGNNNELIQTTRTGTVGSPTVKPTRPPTFSPAVLTVSGYTTTKFYPATFAVYPSSENTISGPLARTDNLCDPHKNNEYLGQIVMVERGGCMFYEKAKHLQNAGAIAVLITQDSYAEPFTPEYNGNGNDLTIPVAMISRRIGERFDNFITMTATWGLDPKISKPNPPTATQPPVSGTHAPTVPPTNKVVDESPKFNKIFKPNEIPGIMCATANKYQYIKKNVKSKSAEKCAKACLKHKNCKFINYRENADVNIRCQLLKKCDQMTATGDWIAYGRVKPSATNAPTSSSDSDFDKNFAPNEDKARKCKTSSSQYYIKRQLNQTIDECATLCTANPNCIYINYDAAAEKNKCDLIKKCKKITTKTKYSYKKIEVEPAGGFGARSGEVFYDTYFKTNQKGSQTSICQAVNEDQVILLDEILTRNDCAKACVENTDCNFINLGDNSCTLLKKCDLIEADATNEILSYEQFDAIDSLTVDESDVEETEEDSDGVTAAGFFAGMGTSIGIAGLAFAGWKYYTIIKSGAYASVTHGY